MRRPSVIAVLTCVLGLMAWACGGKSTGGGTGGTGGESSGTGGASTGGSGPGTGGITATGGSSGGTGGAGTGGASGQGGDTGGSGGAGEPDAGTSTGGARGGTGGSAGHGGSGGGGSGGSGNTISGMIMGKPFNKITTALWIGAPDPNNPPTTVVYVFEGAVQCSAISAHGWDARVGTMQDIELKMGGTAPGTYTVKGGTPASIVAGEAATNHNFLSATPVEQFATSGTVTLTVLNAGKNATGSFDLTFPNGSLKGSFDATWCKTGVEP